jgi:hypothetical protein
MGEMTQLKFELGQAYELGKKLRVSVADEMAHGCPISCPEDMGLLAQIIYDSKDSKGGHLEIGSAAGASAIVALRTMEHYGIWGKVVCIDPMKGDVFWKNVKHLGLADRIEMINAFSHPFPPKLNGRRFATAFIDGDHAYPHVHNDWLNTKDIVDQYIMFHDYRKIDVRKVVLETAQDKDWVLVAIHGWSAVLWKFNPKN